MVGFTRFSAMGLRVDASFLPLPAVGLALSAAGLLGACTSDLDAPDAYSEPSISAGNDTAGDLGLDCDAFPIGAVGAEYDHTPDVSAMDDGSRSWLAETLPEGLEIDERSGRITGTPTTAGTTSVDFTVMDSIGMAATTCDLVINEGLDVNNALVVDEVPFCLRPGEDTLLDLVVDGSGDGTAIRCNSDGGTGNGTRPAGISVNAETCEIEGSITEDRFGTWVFIVRGTQSGAEVFVPYCVTNDESDGYDVSVDHSELGDGGIDATLVPIFRTFNPNAALSVGVDDDPLFTIISPSDCGASCFFGFAFSLNASPFDADTFSITNALIASGAGGPEGFTHGLTIAGPQVDEAFQDRPWTVNLGLDYCLSQTDGPCDGGPNVRANGNGGIEFSILMVPE
ncbi:MAG: putative Ig domain-containing protein [Nannocystaceae bacterium]|nr:putative Ig domain-containing protein [Nannocystaceae bacterium]